MIFTIGRGNEYVDHLHEHFVDPVVVRQGRYVAPGAPGFSSTMRPETLTGYAYPDGPVWAAAATTAAGGAVQVPAPGAATSVPGAAAPVPAPGVVLP
ncbi:hypothetical protein [Micromonospora sp. WMMD1102]|uniref:hypothetical protein n=1 Tax=Micromonospora sp. WMMD1102 TaxID=3016105 RepID=UPI003242CE2C